jgi:5,10-methylene-tetrahydrofolate dehydrogenase/methenyl tetrahydrofolate cyclohydrolase
MNGLVWFVGKQQSGKTFYVADYDDDNNTIMWAAHKKDAISFKTEKAVHRFIHSHLHDRTDIILVQAPVS